MAFACPTSGNVMLKNPNVHIKHTQYVLSSLFLHESSAAIEPGSGGGDGRHSGPPGHNSHRYFLNILYYKLY
jgi:hypothetical protein